jgi:hypothetical protein
MSNWTVWVGGVEVNEYYVDKDKADDIAKFWINKGYTDVAVERVEIGV